MYVKPKYLLILMLIGILVVIPISLLYDKKLEAQICSCAKNNLYDQDKIIITSIKSEHAYVFLNEKYFISLVDISYLNKEKYISIENGDVLIARKDTDTIQILKNDNSYFIIYNYTEVEKYLKNLCENQN